MQPPVFVKRDLDMSNTALKDIQQALNIIRSATDKEQQSTKVKVLELMTQAMLSHVKALEPVSLVKTTSANKVSVKAPKSQNTPQSANNPNEVIPTQPSNLSDVATTADNQNSRFQRENARF